ncbi:methyltransferase domain-containing protein [Micromonospora sp. NPDC005324]|uniref:methyltransferase domain-containing protein n=1 Tax=Micromonospora sp. NPDC005324 TaxID=3157033 RepID=UPI0033B1821A
MTSTHQRHQISSSTPPRDLPNVFDPITTREFTRIGIKDGQRVLDVGAGTGSLTRHLAGLVGSSGRVVAVDSNAKLLDPTAIVHVYERDLRHGLQLPSEAAPFDLINARCALAPLANRTDLLDEMMSLLKPGGWLVLGDIVYSRMWVHRAPSPEDAELLANVVHRVLDVLASQGVDLHWGDRAASLLLHAGMNHVHARTTARTWTGGGPGCQLYADNVHQLADQLLADGATEEDLDRFAELMADPMVVLRSYQYTSTIAQAPAH